MRAALSFLMSARCSSPCLKLPIHKLQESFLKPPLKRARFSASRFARPLCKDKKNEDKESFPPIPNAIPNPQTPPSSSPPRKIHSSPKPAHCQGRAQPAPVLPLPARAPHCPCGGCLPIQPGPLRMFKKERPRRLNRPPSPPLWFALTAFIVRLHRPYGLPSSPLWPAVTAFKSPASPPLWPGITAFKSPASPLLIARHHRL